MFTKRIELGMKNACFVYTFKHLGKVYLNSEIDINISNINNQYKFEMYTIRKRKPSRLFFKNYRGFGLQAVCIFLEYILLYILNFVLFLWFSLFLWLRQLDPKYMPYLIMIQINESSGMGLVAWSCFPATRRSRIVDSIRWMRMQYSIIISGD
jgi:hypothetical protein